MADIIKIDLTDVEDTLQATFQQSFELTTYADGATITLASGRVEEVGGYLYRVESGDLAITDSGVANGTVYIHIKDDGDGTASAYLSVNSGTWDPNKGGYYYTDGAKVIMAMTKATGPIYSNRGRMLSPLDQQRAIGEIFGVHPDTLIMPNPFNFSPCNGVEAFDTNFIATTNDTNVPDITDDRYLRGDTTYTRTGTNNGGHLHGGVTTGYSGATTYMVQSGSDYSVYGAHQHTIATDYPGGGDDTMPKRFSVLFYIRIR